MSGKRHEKIAACIRWLRACLIVLVLAAALRPAAAEAQTLQPALRVVTIGSVTFLQSKFDPALDLRDPTPGRPPVEAVVEWSVEAPPQSVQASQPAAAQRQRSTQSAPQPAADQRQT
jgi:hypothetical protein